MAVGSKRIVAVSLAVLTILTILPLTATKLFDWQESNTPYTIPKVVRQGFDLTMFMNDRGMMGQWALPSRDTAVGCSYPRESPFEHIQSIGFSLGAIVDNGNSRVKRVSSTNDIVSLQTSDTLQGEMLPVDPNHPIYHTSIYFPAEPNLRYVDDDNDGEIDEDQLNGRDDDGDGLIDEDYGAVSESDYYMEYADTSVVPGMGDHHPLGIKISEISYSWGRLVRQPILPFDITITNIGNLNLRDVYVGMIVQPQVGTFLVSQYNNNICGYWPEIMTTYTENPIDSGTTPIGVTLLSLPHQLARSEFSYYWDYTTLGRPSEFYCDVTDSCAYNALAGIELPPAWNHLRPDPLGADFSHRHIIISMGPIDLFAPGDTIRFSFAVVSGSVLRYTQDNLYENAQFAQTLYARDYYPPVVLPPPTLNITPGDRTAHLAWGDTTSENDPRVYWDEKNRLAATYPDTHWRRVNPPTNSRSGGRVFEGFKLYRSDDLSGTAASFTLIRQWDVIDDVGPRYEYDVGIDTTFDDSLLSIGRNYWYSLTSFGIPDVQVIEYPDWDGVVRTDSLFTNASESSVLGSRKKLKLSFAPSTEPDRVLVVPNPYRVDEDYTFEAGGWEGRGKSWSESKRLIRFIHLPPGCTIRIYSLVGEIIATLHHDDPDRGEIDWNLISESGRVIASGIYIFSVDSDFGTQVGKFVVIK